MNIQKKNLLKKLLLPFKHALHVAVAPLKRLANVGIILLFLMLVARCASTLDNDLTKYPPTIGDDGIIWLDENGNPIGGKSKSNELDLSIYNSGNIGENQFTFNYVANNSPQITIRWKDTRGNYQTTRQILNFGTNYVLIMDPYTHEQVSIEIDVSNPGPKARIKVL